MPRLRRLPRKTSVQGTLRQIQSIPQVMEKRSGPSEHSGSPRDRERPPVQRGPRHSRSPRDRERPSVQGGPEEHSSSPRDRERPSVQENTQAVPESRGRRSGPRRSKGTLRQSQSLGADVRVQGGPRVPETRRRLSGPRRNKRTLKIFVETLMRCSSQRRSKRTLGQTQGQEHSRNYGVLDGDVQSKRTLWSPGR